MNPILHKFYSGRSWLDAIQGHVSGERRAALRAWLSVSPDQHDKNEKSVLIERLPPRWGESALDSDLNNLRATVAALPELLDIARDDADIKALADDMSMRCRVLLSGDRDFLGASGLALCMDLARAYGIQFADDIDVEGLQLRVTCRQWWLRCLRVAHAKAREAAAIDAGIVGGQNDLYCSDDTLERRTQQKKRNEALMAGIKMQSSDGVVLGLDDLAAAGMANPDNRAAELITRTKGFEKIASLNKHDGAFITLTCPSRMHAYHSDGRKNRKYDGTKPDAAQKYLCKCWSRARAKLARDDVLIYGLRTVEPHHDGCPHWHLVLFYKAGDGARVLAVLRRYFIADSANEAGAQKHRVKWVDIDASKGSASAYVLKYIQKNLGGIQGVDSDEGGLSSVGAWQRVEAWASTWRIRQFQQIGGHGVGVWRELRRVAADVAENVAGRLRQAWDAAQKRSAEVQADFAEYMIAQGGLKVSPRQSLIRLDVDKIFRRGRYGGALVYKLKGVAERYGFQRMQSNRQEWVRL